MALMFVTYAVLLYRGDSLFWMAMHLLAPSLLMMASQLESYGIWQKGMILYFVAATIVHQGAARPGVTEASAAKVDSGAHSCGPKAGGVSDSAISRGRGRRQRQDCSG